MSVLTAKAAVREAVDAACPSIRTMLARPPIKPPAVANLPVAFIDRTAVQVGGDAADTFDAASPIWEVRLIVLIEPTNQTTTAEELLETTQGELVEWMRTTVWTGTVTAGDRYAVAEMEYRAVVAVVRASEDVI